MHLCRILTAIAVLFLVACKSTNPPTTTPSNLPPPVQYEQGPQAPGMGPRTFTPGVPVAPIQHNPFTITTNDPAVTVPVQQPVSITTTNPFSLFANGLIGTTNDVNVALNIRSFAPAGYAWGVNDTAIFQAAINQCTNGTTLQIPKGDYAISTLTLPVGGNVSLAGMPGARLFQVTTATNAMFFGANAANASLTLTGPLVIDANGTTRTPTANLSGCSLVALTNITQSLICRGVTFTNSLLSFLYVGCKTDIENCQFLSAGENRGTYDAFNIVAAPLGDGATLRVVNSDFIGTSSADADLWKQPHGIFVTENITGTNIFNSVIVSGCYFNGVAGMRNSEPGGAVECYNGAANVVVTGNTVRNFGYSAFKIQRSDHVVVSNNTIEHGYNNQDDYGTAITIEPMAREGFAPFIGPRLGEQHHGFIVEGNHITDVMATAIYLGGGADGAMVLDNVIAGVRPSLAGSVIPMTALCGNVTFAGNYIKSIRENALFINGPWSGVRVLENRVECGTVTNTDAMFLLVNLTDVQIIGNRVTLSTNSNASCFSLVNVTNVLAAQNVMTIWSTNASGFAVNGATNNPASGVQIIENSCDVAETAIAMSSYPIWFTGVTADVHSWNNSWNPFVYSKAQSDLTYLGVENLDSRTNSGARAILGARTWDSGGYLAAYPSSYAGTLQQKRFAVGNNSDATGVDIALYNLSDEFRVMVTNHTRVSLTDNAMMLSGAWNVSLIQDSDNAVSTLHLFKNNGTDRLYFGWNTNYGAVFIDGTGSHVNASLNDNGLLTLREGLHGPVFVDNLSPSALVVSDGTTNLVSVANQASSILINNGSNPYWFAGKTTNINVLCEGGVTNQFQFVSGVLSNIVSVP